ncbi:MAG TPA: hypothetical protein VLA71_17990, partial [Algoriphagus sp.]|nr:hypothetical protein [Algoriphagus sp.]
LAPGKVVGNAGAYQYALEWTDYYSPKAAYQLLKSGFLVRVANTEFSTPEGKTFGRGTILIDKGNSGLDNQAFFAKLQEIAQFAHVDIHAISTGYTGGANMGSTFMVPLKTPQIALLVDGGVDSGEAGEIWHLLDQRMQMPVTLLPVGSVNMANLDRYNVILMADGNYNSLGKSGAEKLKEWTSKGGSLVAKGGAIRWLAQNEIGNFTFRTVDNAEKGVQKSYANFENATGAKGTFGAIFKANLDITHPIGYGYSEKEIYTFRNDNFFMEVSPNPYANPLVYTENPLASGYLHPSNLAGIQNGSVIRISGVGQGRIIGFADNPNFRAFWFGTNKLFMNSIFFGQVIDGGTAR